MKNIKSTKISNLKLCAVFLLIITALMFYYEYVKDKDIQIDTTDIIVAKFDIPENTKISSEMLAIVKRYSDDLGFQDNIVYNADEIIGKRTIVPLYKGEEINALRLIKDQEYMNMNKNKKETAYLLDEVDQALGLKKNDFIDIWKVPIVFEKEQEDGEIIKKVELKPEKLFQNLIVVDTMNSYKIDISGIKQDEIENNDLLIPVYIKLMLSDEDIDKLYNIDKKYYTIKITRHSDNNLFSAVMNSIKSDKPEVE